MSYSIPLFDLNYGQEEEDAVINTLRSKWISMGTKVQEMEHLFCECLGVKYAVGLTNCTAALHLAMKILDIGTDDEVIVPSLTFVATVNAVRYVGANPVFADVTGHDNFSIDPIHIEEKITSRTKAIIVMHYGGFSCDMRKIMKIAAANNINVVEDAAHSPGSEYSGRKLGTIGDIGCFSFFSNKNITCGEGGLLVTDDEKFAEKAKLLRSHGMTSLSYERAKGHATSYDVVDLGYNYRLDDIRSSLMIQQLKRLEKDIRERQKLRYAYLEELAEVEQIIIPYLSNKNISSNYIFPIVLKDCDSKHREEVRSMMKAAGIQTSVHYPAIHRFSIFEKFAQQELPKTEYISDNEVTLPMYPSLGYKNVKYISEMLKRSIQAKY